jgi:hypothetical protein
MSSVDTAFLIEKESSLVEGESPLAETAVEEWTEPGRDPARELGREMGRHGVLGVDSDPGASTAYRVREKPGLSAAGARDDAAGVATPEMF